MYRILISDKLGEIGLERLAQAEDVACDVKLGLPKDELMAIIGGYDAIIMRSGTRVDSELLAAGTRLKVIGRAGIGIDNIDVSTATSKGIVVMNTPQANAIATAEQTMALMLAISRHTAGAHASLKAGEWHRSQFTGRQLYNKVLGLIGLGRVGRQVASRALAFGMELLAYDPFVAKEVAIELGVKMVALDYLLQESDYISLHTVITPKTMMMINAEAIDKMKDGVILINTARGKLVDEEALAQALRNGRVKAAAIDVYGQEPPMANPLIGLANVLHTPHLGASTKEAQRDVATQIVDQVLDALRGKDIRNSVNLPFQVGPDFASIKPYMVLAERLGIMQTVLSPASIRRVELEIRGELAERLVRPVTAGLLKGLLKDSLSDPVNYINAPTLAEENGITIFQTIATKSGVDYPNMISCRTFWDEGSRLLVGVLFGGARPRLVQAGEFQLDARLGGTILILESHPTPGVIAQIDAILGAVGLEIGEWQLGRHKPDGEILSLIGLGSDPSPDILKALQDIQAIKQVKVVKLT